MNRGHRRRRAPGGPRRGDAHRDRGASEALGLVLIMPAMLAFALVVVSVGRSVDGKAQARSAAAAAAQAAAQQRSKGAALAAVDKVVAVVGQGSASCPTAKLEWSPPIGARAGLATVTLTCVSAGSESAVASIAATTFEVTASATIDPLRADDREGP